MASIGSTSHKCLLALMQSIRWEVGLCRFSVSILAVFAIMQCASPALSEEVFSDNFDDRPDGPLGAPWSLMNDTLHVKGQRVVANSHAYGNMGYWGTRYAYDASIEAVVNFNGALDDGRFDIMFGGGDGEQNAYWFEGTFGSSFFSITRARPHEEIAVKYRSFDVNTTYRILLEYSSATETVVFTVMDLDANIIDEIEAYSPSDPFSWCAIAIDNGDDSGKWMDDVIFTTDNLVAVRNKSWGQTKALYR